jgi:hypothetical protein
LQANNKRLEHGAPDFSTISDTITWASSDPNGTDFGPIRNMPGWKNFRRNFFLIADSVVCVPYGFDVARFFVQFRGRAILTVNNKKVATMVLLSFSISSGVCKVTPVLARQSVDDPLCSAQVLSVVQDDKSFDVKYTRSVASHEIDDVSGQCLDVNVKYLHSRPFGSSFYLGVIFGNRVRDGGKARSITYATKKYLEVKVYSTLILSSLNLMCNAS